MPIDLNTQPAFLFLLHSNSILASLLPPCSERASEHSQVIMASKLSFKRTDSIAESMPDALKQSRYQMKRCFQR